ncbi:katanin-like protein [Leptomonas seymouri]|uniref:Katanin p60 ATPase-containing subunit A-like 2 n=1 Tax=Leptomonas seymouri TaxID=5684 RepID=A0A0N0P897_LEPSE|nr:katanin-like protein [Leptomonas seymouri]|eukprot:KPI89696.1 katanin-like protein [Leptomonas seymouri]
MPTLQPLANTMAPAAGSSLAHMKGQQLAREEEEKLRARRVKGIVVLVEQFLLEQGYTQSLQALQQESRISLAQHCVADNIDLLSVMQDFEDYYEFRCQRKPKLFRMRNGGEELGGAVANEGGEKLLTRKRKTGAASSGASVGYGNPQDTSSSNANGNSAAASSAPPSTKPPAHLRPSNLARALGHAHGGGRNNSGGAGSDTNINNPTLSLHGEAAPLGAGVGGVAGATVKSSGSANARNEEGNADDDNLQADFSHRALKPLPQFPNNELNDLAATILREILDVNPSVRWRDIADLEGAKHLLKEAVVMPVKYPELFQGILRPWKGILLFGPPGTGKTLLAKAVATECRTTFFNISASSVVSKWRGDSEKLVRMLFELAVHYAPSTIFIDEIDSLMSARSTDGEHEGSRRMKTELLTQMDGLSKRRGGDVVFVLAASNVPWDLDTAMLRRLEKRVLVTLPTAEARKIMFRRLLPTLPQDADYDTCAALTENMSGADIDIVCREAMMRPVRKLIEQLEAAGDAPGAPSRLSREPLKPPCATLEDVQASIACTRSSVKLADMARYDIWTRDYGSGLSK